MIKTYGLISEIVYGVTTWRLTLDEIIKKYSNIKIKKISIWIKNILRMGIYQIIFLDKIPKSAAVNESVNLAKRYGHRASSNFVNAILRKVKKEDYEEICKQTEIKKQISFETSMPEWIVEKLLQEKDVNTVRQICINSNKRPKISIRINSLKTTKSELIQVLENEQIKVEEGILDNFLYIKNAKNINNKQSFIEGKYIVQDEVAAMPGIILQPKENEKILDACSAPGGKTTYIAEIMNNTGEIEAWDIHNHRTKLVEENAKRLGITNIKTKVKDASIYDENYKEKFDRILLDVPCLGLGVLKRKPDIKWQKEEKDVEEIKKVQLKILETCSNYVKKGGVIVYSTCSIIKEENEDIIKEFLKKNKNFELEKLQIDIFNEYLENQTFLKVYQNEKTDGFFIAKLNRK